jgi:hypothetical protein
MNTEHQYTIIIDSDKSIVEGLVSEKLREGWQCVGGVSVYVQEFDRGGYQESCNTYAQAMWRERLIETVQAPMPIVIETIKNLPDGEPLYYPAKTGGFKNAGIETDELKQLVIRIETQAYKL